MSAQPGEVPEIAPAFSLRHLVIDVLDEMGPATIENRGPEAVEVLRRIPRKHKAEAFLTALTEYVAKVDVSRRPQLHPVPPLPSGDNANSAKSGTAQAMRHLGRVLRATYAVVEGKEIGDYDADDCTAVAGDLEARAADMAAKAAQFRAVADRLAESDAKCVRDLPDAFLLAVFYGGRD